MNKCPFGHTEFVDAQKISYGQSLTKACTTPADIGVPLTVLGILPILYNTVVTLTALSKIKRILRKSRLTALTRSDVVNKVIEIELPRYAVAPWDRFRHRDEYWTLCRHPSSIPGGSWTTFNWKTNAIGIKTQRIEYADQLRQPQVEVVFEDLICYLLDLGAVPDAQGWKILRSTGHWTPVGCALMRSPDGVHKALTIAPADDSDGNLSLAVTWSPGWTARDCSSLPPYWVRLCPPPPPAAEASASPPKPSTSTRDEKKSPFEEDVEEATTKPVKSTKSTDSVTNAVASNASATIVCQVSADGLVSALVEETGPENSAHFNSLHIEHVRLAHPLRYVPAPASASSLSSSSSPSPKSAGTWFASAITAYGTGDQTVLWNYRIPDSILHFSRKSTIPCGVLVQLDMAAMSETPEWATQYEDARAEAERFDRRMRDQHRAIQAEWKLPPQQRAEAQRQRLMLEAEQRLQEMRDKVRRDEERAETRILEALQSPRWDNQRASACALNHLKKRDKLPGDCSLKQAVGNVLHRMLVDSAFAAKMTAMLDMWQQWADTGGMRRGDFAELKRETECFALAVLMVALVGDTADKQEGTLAVDLQQCLVLWKKVRLG